MAFETFGGLIRVVVLSAALVTAVERGHTQRDCWEKQAGKPRVARPDKVQEVLEQQESESDIHASLESGHGHEIVVKSADLEWR